MVTRALPRSVDALASLFALIGEFFEAEGLDGARAFPVELVAEELFTNVVRHGAGSGPIDVTLAREGPAVAVTLAEHGTGPFDPRSVPAPDPDLPLERRRGGGMGLHIVRQLADLRYHHHGRTGTLTAVVRLET
jgi:anti-sigma regulatory factor (Ser/Thr protein kinase)